MRHRFLTAGIFAGVGLCLVTALHEWKTETKTIEAELARGPVITTQPVLASAVLPPRAVVPPRAAKTAGENQAAHLIYIEPQADERVPQADHPGLDRALDDEEENRPWATQVRSDFVDVLSADAQLRVDEVRCAQTFCRVRMTKPIASDLDWPQVDSLLAPIARGETLFAAAPSGTMTTGTIYFSADDAVLPLDQAHPAWDDEE